MAGMKYAIGWHNAHNLQPIYPQPEWNGLEPAEVRYSPSIGGVDVGAWRCDFTFRVTFDMYADYLSFFGLTNARTSKGTFQLPQHDGDMTLKTYNGFIEKPSHIESNSRAIVVVVFPVYGLIEIP